MYVSRQAPSPPHPIHDVRHLLDLVHRRESDSHSPFRSVGVIDPDFDGDFALDEHLEPRTLGTYGLAGLQRDEWEEHFPSGSYPKEKHNLKWLWK